MNKRQVGNKLRPEIFWMAKSILANTTFMDLGEMTLLCMTFELYVEGQQSLILGS